MALSRRAKSATCPNLGFAGLVAIPPPGPGFLCEARSTPVVQAAFDSLQAQRTVGPIRRSLEALAMTPLFELNGLDAIDWPALGHAYGSAIDTPTDLRSLTSAMPELRAHALQQREMSICHQGSLYSDSIPPGSGRAA